MWLTSYIVKLQILHVFFLECGTRFTHANRHCPDHPNQALVRDEANMPTPTLDTKSSSPHAIAWLQRLVFKSFKLL